eukprot:5798101-Pleurochrysis_carterae.AAC.1
MRLELEKLRIENRTLRMQAGEGARQRGQAHGHARTHARAHVRPRSQAHTCSRACSRTHAFVLVATSKPFRISGGEMDDADEEINLNEFLAKLKQVEEELRMRRRSQRVDARTHARREACTLRRLRAHAQHYRCKK